jgi:hypothetical protein
MLTGHVLKDPEKILTSDAHSPHPHPHPHPSAPIEIDANLAAVERVLKSVAN